MKPRSGPLVGRYARSVFGVALERGALDAVRRDLEAVHMLWSEQPELKSLLVNPGLSRQKVKAILEAIAEKLTLHAITRAFIGVVLDKDRLDILDAMHLVFEQLVFAHEGKIEVKVTTAVPVNDALRKQIEVHLKQQSGMDPVVEWRQNPSIIGGVVIEWPDHVFDGSLARKIQNMQVQIAGTV